MDSHTLTTKYTLYPGSLLLRICMLRLTKEEVPATMPALSWALGHSLVRSCHPDLYEVSNTVAARAERMPCFNSPVGLAQKSTICTWTPVFQNQRTPLGASTLFLGFQDQKVNVLLSELTWYSEGPTFTLHGSVCEDKEVGSP